MKVKNLSYYIAFAIIIFLPLSSVIPNYGTDVWYVQYISFLAIGFLGLSFLLFTFNKYYGLLSAFCVYSSIFTANQHPRAFLTLGTLYLSMFAVWAVSKITNRQGLFRALFVGVIIQSIWIIVQKFNADPIFSYIHDPTIDVPWGSLGSPNQIGVFFAVTLPAVLLISPIFAVLNIAGLMVSTTTWAMLGAVSSCAVFVYYANKKLLWLFLAAAVVSGTVFFGKFERISAKTVQERKDLVIHCINAVLKERLYIDEGQVIKVKTCSKWTGYGLGNFIRFFPHSTGYFINKPGQLNIYSHRYEHAHNDILEVFVELGILGVIPLILGIFDYFRRFFLAHKTKLLVTAMSMFIAQLVSGMGVYTTQTAVSGMLLIISLGIIEGEIRGQEAKMG